MKAWLAKIAHLFKYLQSYSLEKSSNAHIFVKLVAHRSFYKIKLNLS